MYIDVHTDVGHGLRKDLCVRRVAADEHALQRPGVLETVSVLCDIRKDYFRVVSTRKEITADHEAQMSESR